MPATYRHRYQESRLAEAFAHFPAVALLGARQVGKTTLLTHLYGEVASTVTFDPLDDVGGARADPELFVQQLRVPCILDEIQYSPQIIPALKRRIDRERRAGLFMITGSQQWEVMRHLAESLAGRVALLELEAFSLAELVATTSSVKAHDGWLAHWLDGEESEWDARPSARLPLPLPLGEQLWRGFLPAAQALPASLVPTFWSSYRQTYLERDVRIFADISDLETFSRFLSLCAALSAQEINFSQLGREIGLSPQTSKRWLDILGASFQWAEIPAWSGNAIKKLSGRPKGYICDTGLLCQAQAIASPTTIAGHPLWGAIFETAVVQEIRKQISGFDAPPKLYHWRAHSGAEVDLVVERDGKVFPIEIKAHSQPSARDTKGMQAFRDSYPTLDVRRGLIICPGAEHRRLTKTDWVIPWDCA